MISTDKNILSTGSAVGDRIVGYGKKMSALHVIVFTGKDAGFKEVQKISANTFVHPTLSSSKYLRFYDAIRIGRRLIKSISAAMGGVNKNIVITAQDPFETSLTATCLSYLYGIPFQLQVHTDFLSPFFYRESFLNKLRVICAKIILPKAHGIRVVSKKIKQSLFSHFSKITKEIDVLPIFVDINRIKASSPIFNLKEKYPDFDFLIVMASRLSPEKNIQLAIRALSMVVKKYPKTGLIIIGEGERRLSLVRLVHDLKIGNSVVFEGWQENLISYYKTANLFLLSSNYEGYGMTLLEAAAAGCPIISTDVGIAGELLAPETLIKPGDLGGLVKRMEKFIASPAERENSRKFTGRHLTGFIREKDEYAKEFVGLLSKLIPNNG